MIRIDNIPKINTGKQWTAVLINLQPVDVFIKQICLQTKKKYANILI